MNEVKCPNCGHRFTPGVDAEWAKRMREQRLAAGITLKRLGEYLGFSAVYVSDMERGKRNKPHPFIVERWERFLREMLCHVA